jgi:hypothetical protein
MTDQMSQQNFVTKLRKRNSTLCFSQTKLNAANSQCLDFHCRSLGSAVINNYLSTICLKKILYRIPQSSPLYECRGVIQCRTWSTMFRHSSQHNDSERLLERSDQNNRISVTNRLFLVISLKSKDENTPFVHKVPRLSLKKYKIQLIN